VAIEQGKDRVLALWYLMRHLDSIGRGRVLRSQLKGFVEQERLASQEILRRRLLEGEGQFWTTKMVGEKQVISYRSLQRCSELLGVAPSSAVRIPLSAFSGLAKMRAFLYASLFAGRKNPIARETIAELWGIPKTTQRRYEKLAGIEVRRNVARKEIDPRDGWQVGEGAFVYHYRGKWYWCCDLPNSYETNLAVQSPGMIRRVRKALWAFHEGKATTRVFFGTPKQAVRSKRKGQEVYFRDTSWERQRSFRGALLWGVCS